MFFAFALEMRGNTTSTWIIFFKETICHALVQVQCMTNIFLKNFKSCKNSDVHFSGKIKSRTGSGSVRDFNFLENF